MISYVSSLDTNKKQSALNTCLKSLNNMLDYHKFDEEKQSYTELRYNGDISTLANIEIKFPRKMPTTIPVFGMIMGTIPVVVGYTDGIKVSVNPKFMDYVNKAETDFKTDVDLVDEAGEFSVTKDVVVREEKNRLKITETTYTTIEYIEVPGEYEGEYFIFKYTYYQIIREYDYNKCKIIIFERF